MRSLGVLVLAAACTPHRVAAPAAPADAGISIALYDRGAGEDAAYGVVDDRRWVELTGKELVLEHIDPGAALASLVIEPLGGAELRFGECARSEIPKVAPRVVAAVTPVTPAQQQEQEQAALRHARLQRRLAQRRGARVDTPPTTAAKDASTERFDATVRCAVDGKPGRYLIRVLYVSSALKYRAQHEVGVLAGDRATVTSRFAIVTPAWRESAEVALFDGVPGGDRPPHEVARGTIVLDGSTAVIAVPTHEVPARLRRIYDGAVPTPELPAADAAWNADSTQAVWVWLELQQIRLAPGPVRVHVELAAEGTRDVDVPAAGRQQAERADAPLRLPLWVDDTLRGMRQRFRDLGDGAQLAERVMLSVGNLGDTPREVWVEEHVRPAHRRRVERAWPIKPAATGDLLRSKLEIRPRRVERVGYTITYDF